jgi:NAD(P)-dependent dehydrogenase (short-subunit alcohol dehydrogenase family)
MADLRKLARNIASFIKIKNVVPVYETREKGTEFSGKAALVIGGTGGIGTSICQKLAEGGCSVIVSGSRKESVDKALSEIQNEDRVKGLVLNLKEYDSYKQKVQEAVSIFGKIDILVFCAGVHTEHVDFWNMTQQEYSRVMDINLKSEYFICQAVASYMRDNKIKGHILLITSTRGLEPAYSPYGLSKWGSNGFVKGLAELLAGYGITVNGIAPGSTATPLIGIDEGKTIWTSENKEERYVMPLEVAEVAAVLVSDAGRMINGNVVAVSGGRGTFDIR